MRSCDGWHLPKANADRMSELHGSAKKFDAELSGRALHL
jgi:hypothetical protein